MPHFGSRSRKQLATCCDELVVIAEEGLDVGMDFAVIQGHRGRDEQEAYFFAGLSRLRWGESPHNQVPSLAFDAAPWPIDWRDRERFYHLAGILRAVAHRLGIPLRWGGDWDRDFDLRDQSFMDLVHYEIVEGRG